MNRRAACLAARNCHLPKRFLLLTRTRQTPGQPLCDSSFQQAESAPRPASGLWNPSSAPHNRLFTLFRNRAIGHPAFPIALCSGRGSRADGRSLAILAGKLPRILRRTRAGHFRRRCDRCRQQRRCSSGVWPESLGRRELRQHVRPFGNHGDRGLRTVFRQRLAHGLLHAGSAGNKQPIERFGGQAVAHDAHLGLAPHLGQLFELPLVHHEVIAAQDSLAERFEILMLGKQPFELRTADALAEAGCQHDGAPLLDDGEGARQSFDRLVKGRVQRIAGEPK